MGNILGNTKGITLVALVVTIIIILILAGITMAFTLGPNGIIERAKDAKAKYEIASSNEETALNKLSNELESGDYSDISAADFASLTKLSDNTKKTQAVDKEGKALYYKDDTALTANDLTNITNDTTKVTVSDGKTIDDYKVYYKEATADNISAGAAAYVDGKLVLGNGSDNEAYYKKGTTEITSETKQTVYASLYGATAKRYSYTGFDKGWHNAYFGGSDASGSASVTYTVPILTLPDSSSTSAMLNILAANIEASQNKGSASISFVAKTDTGKILVNTSGTQTVSLNLFSTEIGDAKTITFTISGSFSPGEYYAGIKASNIYTDYLIPKN